VGLLTGSAFPQGSAIIKWTLSLPEKAEGFTKDSSVPIKSGLRSEP